MSSQELAGTEGDWKEWGLTRWLDCKSEVFQHSVDMLDNPASVQLEPITSVVAIPHGLTLLHVAVLRNDLPSVQYLLSKHQADPHSPPPEGYTGSYLTPFQLGCLLFRPGADAMAIGYELKASHFYQPLELMGFKGGEVQPSAIVDTEDLSFTPPTKADDGKSGKLNDIHKSLPDHQQQENSRKAAANHDNLEFAEKFSLGLMPHFAAAGGKLDTLASICRVAPSSVTRKSTVMGLQPLHCGAANGELETVRFLLMEAKVDSTTGDEHGRTALLWATRNGHLEVVKWLLTEGGVSPTQANADGDTALLWAARKGHLPIIQWLLQHGGAKPDESNKYGDTALVTASSKGYLECVKWLLEVGGSSVTEHDVDGNSALLWAAQGGHLRVVQWLLQRTDVRAATKAENGDTPLLAAAAEGRLNIVQWLIEEGHSQPTECGRYGTAFLQAAQGGHLDVVKWLLEHGADTTDTNQCGLTALLCACAEGRTNVVQYLITHGYATANEKDQNGNTALLCASWFGRLPIIQWLLEEKSSRITEKNRFGQTALLCAAHQGDLEVVRWLLQQGGSNISEANDDGDTALLRAAQNGKFDIVQFLVAECNAPIGQCDVDGVNPLQWACRRGHLAIVKWLVEEAGADLHTKNYYGETAILCAASCGHVAVLEYLADHGGNLSDTDSIRLTPLLMGAKCGSVDVVKWLLETKRANISEVDSAGHNALLLAAEAGDPLVCGYLLHGYGVQHNCAYKLAASINSYGTTALELAYHNGKAAVLHFLVRQGWASPHDVPEPVPEGCGDVVTVLRAPWSVRTHPMFPRQFRQLVAFLMWTLKQRMDFVLSHALLSFLPSDVCQHLSGDHQLRGLLCPEPFPHCCKEYLRIAPAHATMETVLVAGDGS
eukprot:TRINITY_DN60019_c0_g1_i1.p1 TRINITY_DN60019_c0_g1~~TRINITY_DN60019_c0_g1_i1.p1  ORF type:complete len:887 (-),score=31.15 TRINITY_DN60019_c0_g1_i1:106-2766(-)